MLHRQQADELYRCNDDKQRRLDCALTTQLHMQLERSALEVCAMKFDLCLLICVRGYGIAPSGRLQSQESVVSEMPSCHFRCLPSIQLSRKTAQHCAQGQCDTLRCEASSWRQVAMDQAKQLALFGLRVDELSQENSFLRQVKRVVLCALAAAKMSPPCNSIVQAKNRHAGCFYD